MRARHLPHSAADEEEEDDGEEHEQIRLVETPDPVAFPTMDDGKNIQTVGDLYNGKFTNSNGNHFHNGNSFTSASGQNGYPQYFSSKENNAGSFKSDLHKIFANKCKCTPLKWIIALIPILSWLPKYDWKSDLAFDMAAGFTVAVMHIPQGMAYAMLSNVEPIVGLYMAFYPVIMYSILGTSRHVSMGTFAVVCLMSGKVASERVTHYSTVPVVLTAMGNISNTTALNDTTNYSSYSTNEIVTVVSICVGVWQVIPKRNTGPCEKPEAYHASITYIHYVFESQILIGVFQLGSLSVLLSAELISGFTTGSAVHVFTSQLKNLFGIEMKRRSGIFKIPLTYWDTVLGIKAANITAVLLSCVTISLLILYNEFLKPMLNKRIPFPIPIELITIIVGTLVSRYWITSDKYGISIVNHIPTGLPDAKLPPLELVPDVLVDSLIIAVVAYAISISMAKIFASKHQYKVGPNQELLANGTSNIFGSFFGCAPISASLSRSLIQEQIGGKTQLAGLFSCSIILLVLLWLGPFFVTLPHCILSSLIIVALKGMFMQIADLPKAWKESRINGSIWLVTFLATVFLDIEYGLLIGVLITVASLLWKSNAFIITEVGQDVHSHMFVEKTSVSNMMADVNDVKILKLTGNLNFSTAETFTSEVNNILDSNLTYLQRKRSLELSSGKKLKTSAARSQQTFSASTIILDFSSVSTIDPAGLKAVREQHDKQAKQGVEILYVGCPSSVFHVMQHCKFLKYIGIQYFFPNIDYAVSYVKRKGRSIADQELIEIFPDN
ncbi:Prestin [Orchesella cincta]|uniref:Prestin n=1 Tax=Orchesella cincta TaxID=48709 RepID=A0A1D2NFL5_ORCCI|nr:Prestin [Orchesella cincta]